MKKLAAAMIPLVLAGCAASSGKSKFACPGMPAGVVCKTPLEVYEMTNHADSVSEAVRKPPKIKERAPLLRASYDNPKPILEPAKVMRVWIAPWVDENQDLHWPSYVFSEITPRRWSFGETEIGKAPVIVPLAARVSPLEPPSHGKEGKGGKGDPRPNRP